MNMMNLIIYMFLISCLLTTIFYKHLLITLMTFEMLMLSMMMFMYMYLLMMKFEYFLLMYLVIIVCEGVLGLTLLILFIRFKSNDKIKLINLLMW